MKNITLAALAVCLATALSSPLRAGSGLETTDNTGNKTNKFANKSDVYILATPGDGTYFFQVTNPNQGTVLSTDPAVCRQISVVGGVASSFDGSNLDGLGCSHAVVNLGSGVFLIQAGIPPDYFATTPNPGGVYKVDLITENGCGVTIAQDGIGLNFSNSCKKSKNFKVADPGCTTGDCTPIPPQSQVSGIKFNDLNANGIFDIATEGPLSGWNIVVTGTSLGAPISTTIPTDSLGNWSITLDQNTSVTACEVIGTKTGWIQSAPLSSAVVVGIPVITTGASIDPSYAPNCWSGTITTDTSGLNFGNYAQLVVSKTAGATYTRTYSWSISKTANSTLFEQTGGTVSVGYKVAVAETGAQDSLWAVSGTITVNNPNSGNVIATVSDSIDNSGTCTGNYGSGLTLAPGNNTYTYSCTFGANPTSGTNTASASWAGVAPPNGTATYAFGAPTSRVNQSVTITDNFNGSLTATTLGTAGPATDPPATLYSHNFTPSFTFTVPASGCVNVTNKATITQTNQQSSAATVEICGPANTGALSMGFWKNPGQKIISGGASTSGVCNSGTYLRTFNPFKDLSATANCATVASYVAGVIGGATCGGSTCNAMLKSQMLATALDVYFGGGGGGNPISAPSPVGSLVIDLTKICYSITGTGTCASGAYENDSSAFGGSTSLSISAVLTYAGSQSTSGGITWYGNVKATQVTAKDVFDAINNMVVFAP